MGLTSPAAEPMPSHDQSDPVPNGAVSHGEASQEIDKPTASTDDMVRQAREASRKAIGSPRAQETDADSHTEPQVRTPLIEAITPVIVWGCLLSMALAVGMAAYGGEISLAVGTLFTGGLIVFIGLMILAWKRGTYSPVLLAIVMMRRPLKLGRADAALAGNEVLTALGLAEGILDSDADARLLTTRTGVVLYANKQYQELARGAGVIGATGLPPRIDRLFGQAVTESSKMFRLARAARSGSAADEVITQSMATGGKGTETGQGTLRRFEISLRPVSQSEEHMAWRIREVPVENARDDLKRAYLEYPRPVIAVERSGQLTWFNRAASSLINVKLGAPVALGDFLLGEPSETITDLWADKAEEIEGRIRPQGARGAPTGVIFSAFSRGGIGEGFVCVEMQPKGGATADGTASDVAADVTDAPMGIAVAEGELGADATLSSVNTLFATAFGAEVGQRLTEALPTEAMRDLVAAVRSRSGSNPLTRPVEVTIGEGDSARIFRLFARPIKRRRGAYGRRQTVLYTVDVSLQKRLEKDSTHNSRLKAIGFIAGTIAHDFNNFLMAMMGNTELLMRRHPAGDASYPDLVAIRENAQRARYLTQNLLAFARKQTLRNEVLNITDFLADFTPFIQRYVTEKIRIDVRHGRDVPPVKVDKVQLELAIMNLAVNARDAMDKGGKLTISSRRVLADEVESFGYGVLENTDYALIEVADTGPGVPKDIAEKIFEPFFTTKGEGKGTGLGLSTVHGVIGQMGGRIFLHNRPGEGATFQIFLPEVSAEQIAAMEKEKSSAPATPVQPTVEDPTGKGRILIVEDEDSVRSIVVRALAMCGYDITEAPDGDEALDIIEEADTPFDVVLTDIMMPEMDGPTLIQEAGEKLQGARVIFMSGYAEAAMRDKLDAIEGSIYLQKPITLKKVAATVKEAMAK